MNKKYVIGIDTSNYTTSVALVDENGKVVANVKKLLPVKAGECGLRQSDAVFAHIKNVPVVMEEVKNHLQGAEIAAIGVSSKPRNEEKSYMPCFMCGIAVANAISAITGAPIFEFSHQCGHVMAALYSSGALDICKSEFAAFHVSGGTTELLCVKYNGSGFDTEIVGGTKDLNAGQLIDRIGVMLGLGFPCGQELERIALSRAVSPSKAKAKTDADSAYFNLSGAENLAKKLYAESNDPVSVAQFVFNYVANTLAESTKKFFELKKEMPIVYAGGVMSNSIIKEVLRKIPNSYFAEPSFSSDNAVGTALLAYNTYNRIEL
jgi:N6-L-threonylcarbamoyladenine synthase